MDDPPDGTPTVLSTLAMKGVLNALGLRCRLSLAPTAVLLQRIEAGERGDVGLLTADGVNALIAEGAMIPGSRLDLATSSVGIAVRSGAAKPEIATVEQFKRAIVGAKSIVYSRSGASGIHFVKLIERLDIADVVNAKAIIVPSGFTAEWVARGEAEMAVQQVSELMGVDNVDVIGPIPSEVQELTVFSAGIFTASRCPGSGLRLIEALASDDTGPVYLRNGLEPLFGRAMPPHD